MDEAALEAHRMGNLARLHGFRQACLCLERLVWHFETVVAKAERVGAHFLSLLPEKDPRFRTRPALDFVMDQRRASNLWRTRGIVAQDQLMAVGLVVEAVPDSFVLQQAADEREIRLAILHAVVPHRIAPGQLPDDIQMPLVREDLLQDLGNTLLQENPRLGPPREAPEVGDQLGAVLDESRLLVPGQNALPLRQRAKAAVDEARRAAREREPDRAWLVEEQLELQRTLGEQVKLEAIGFRESLRAR